jgi:hypothetical protein
MGIPIHKRKSLNYLIISLLFVFCRQVQQVVARDFLEIISDPINLSASDNRVVQHAELPTVTDEVSVTLRLNVLSYDPNWACVFHKGITSYVLQILIFLI